MNVPFDHVHVSLAFVGILAGRLGPAGISYWIIIQISMIDQWLTGNAIEFMESTSRAREWPALSDLGILYSNYAEKRQ